jgi:hypothetical protein
MSFHLAAWRVRARCRYAGGFTEGGWSFGTEPGLRAVQFEAVVVDEAGLANLFVR